jgi:hypothetical protein
MSSALTALSRPPLHLLMSNTLWSLVAALVDVVQAVVAAVLVGF